MTRIPLVLLLSAAESVVLGRLHGITPDGAGAVGATNALAIRIGQ